MLTDCTIFIECHEPSTCSLYHPLVLLHLIFVYCLYYTIIYVLHPLLYIFHHPVMYCTIFLAIVSRPQNYVHVHCIIKIHIKTSGCVESLSIIYQNIFYLVSQHESYRIHRYLLISYIHIKQLDRETYIKAYAAMIWATLKKERSHILFIEVYQDKHVNIKDITHFLKT